MGDWAETWIVRPNEQLNCPKSTKLDMQEDFGQSYQVPRY